MVRLLCIEWVPPHGPWDDQLALIFDGGAVTTELRLSSHDTELAEFRFVHPHDLSPLLRPRLWRRTQIALDVLQRRTGARYLHDGAGAPVVDRGEITR